MRHLRDYQREAITDLIKRWDAGATRVPLVLATGLGKTEIFTALESQWVGGGPEQLADPLNSAFPLHEIYGLGKRVLVLAHTDELIEQAARKARQRNPHLTVGIVKAGLNEAHAQIVVSSRQTLQSAKRREGIRNVGLILVDECFPAGTLVGGKPIEALRPGDMVPSWDEESGRCVQAPVVALMRRKPSDIVQVTLDSGEKFACTPNHPILTDGGWCPAGGLWRGASVVSFTHDAVGPVHRVSSGIRSSDAAVSSANALAEDGQGVRHGRMSSAVGGAGQSSTDGSDESTSRSTANAEAQSDGAAGVTREDARHAEGDQSQAKPAWRERQADSGAAAQAGGVSGLAYRGDDSAKGRGASASLQRRHRPSDDEGSGRGGRGIPFLAGAPRLRPSQDATPGFARVVNVQVLQPGSDGTYSGVCPDGFVYNIEVAGTHTYLIGDGVVAHNCHHALRTNTYGKILEHYGAFECTVCSGIAPEIEDTDCSGCSGRRQVKVAGFTATLARGDKGKLSSVWEDCTFRRDILFGIRHGYLLDVRGERVIVPDFDLSKVKKVAGDFSDSSLADELERTFAPQVIAKRYSEAARSESGALRQGIVFWPLVDTAYHGAAAFAEEEIPSAVIHGGLPKEERRLILKRFAAGEITVVHNCMVLTEGFDAPWADVVVIARPTQSAALYQQMVGRVLRPDLTVPAEQRGKALILDVVGAARQHDLRSLIDLSPERKLAQPDGDADQLSLLELDDWAIQDEERRQSAAVFDDPTAAQWTGETATVAFDPLHREKVWARTPDGVFYMSAGTDQYVFLSESWAGEPGTWDVVWCSKLGPHTWPKVAGAQGLTEYVGLPLEEALLCAEDVALERGGYGTKTLTSRKAPWRKVPPTVNQLNAARAAGIKVPMKEGFADLLVTPDTSAWTKGELSEALDAAKAARRIDPLVRVVKANNPR